MCLLRLDRMEKPYLDPDIHPMDVLLYRARAEDMDTVIIAREVLLRRGAHTRVDMYSSNSGTAFRLQSTAKSWKPDR